jgi:(2Fe-2S) ferredoxin
MRYSRFERIPFGLTGEFIRFVLGKDGKPRALELRWLGRSIVIKIAKFLRDDRYEDWRPGINVQIWGTQKISKKTEKLKLNADRLVLLPAASSSVVPFVMLPLVENPTTSRRPTSAMKPPCIKICGKPDCMKRGGKKMCEKLEHCLESGIWDPEIQIQLTGCMGKCSKGPNLVVMPDKTRYTQVKAKEIPQVLNRHFPVYSM